MAGERQRWCIGVDLGKRNDRSAIAAVQVVDVDSVGGGVASKSELHLRYLERLPQDMPYPVQCSRIAALVNLTREFEHAEIAVDSTGVGVAVVDLLREELRRPFVELTISAGAQVIERSGSEVSVPKRDLAANLSVVMQQQRLRVAEALPDIGALVEELENFEMKISDSGHDAYGARTGHDDLVLAVAYAVWLAERGTGPTSAAAWTRYLRAWT